MSAIRRLFGNFRSPGARPEKPETADRSTLEWAIVGLGNPGEEYAHSRHNSGFMVIDRIAKENSAGPPRKKFKGLAAEAEIAGRAVILVKPQTYYNASGECVAALLGYFKVVPQRLIVVHDELDLEAGRLRIKCGGGDAGNRGVRSIAQSLGTAEFIRVRVGIGRPGAAEDAKERVLKTMTRAQMQEFDAALDRAADAVKSVIADGLERAMNRYNQRD
ncbi:MAG TPA: aminoacyl-tRNA hydrolase [Candidatus Binataceae bacterium]|nr:aminoacyl-tRNA hydrolase [Candidatus Binataceae bacterium]